MNNESRERRTKLSSGEPHQDMEAYTGVGVSTDPAIIMAFDSNYPLPFNCALGDSVGC